MARYTPNGWADHPYQIPLSLRREIQGVLNNAELYSAFADLPELHTLPVTPPEARGLKREGVER